LMTAVTTVYKDWNKRASTHKLNTWLSAALERHSPPLTKQKRPIQIKYITQIKTRPPTFALFTNHIKELPDSYHRYLMNEIKKAFDFKGIPIRLTLKKSKNPYEKNK